MRYSIRTLNLNLNGERLCQRGVVLPADTVAKFANSIAQRASHFRKPLWSEQNQDDQQNNDEFLPVNPHDGDSVPPRALAGVTHGRQGCLVPVNPICGVGEKPA